jgi:hypothetical protein
MNHTLDRSRIEGFAGIDSPHQPTTLGGRLGVSGLRIRPLEIGILGIV